MGCDVRTEERFIRRGHKADLAFLLEIASGQAVQDMDLRVLFRLFCGVCNTFALCGILLSCGLSGIFI